MGHHQQQQRQQKHCQEQVALPPCSYQQNNYSFESVIAKFGERAKGSAIENNEKAAPANTNKKEVFHTVGYGDPSKPVYGTNACGQCVYMGNEVVQRYFKLDPKGALKEWVGESKTWISHDADRIKPYYAAAVEKVDSLNAKVAIKNSEGTVVGHVRLYGDQIPKDACSNILSGSGQFVPTEQGKALGMTASNYHGTSLKLGGKQEGGKQNWGLVFIGQPPAERAYDTNPVPNPPLEKPTYEEQRVVPVPPPVPAEDKTLSLSPDEVKPYKRAAKSLVEPGDKKAEEKSVTGTDKVALVRPAPGRSDVKPAVFAGLEMQRNDVVRGILEAVIKTPTLASGVEVKRIEGGSNLIDPNGKGTVPEQFEIKNAATKEVIYLRIVQDPKTKGLGILCSQKPFHSGRGKEDGALPGETWQHLNAEMAKIGIKVEQTRQGFSLRNEKLPEWMAANKLISGIKSIVNVRNADESIKILDTLRKAYGIASKQPAAAPAAEKSKEPVTPKVEPRRKTAPTPPDPFAEEPVVTAPKVATTSVEVDPFASTPKDLIALKEENIRLETKAQEKKIKEPGMKILKELKFELGTSGYTIERNDSQYLISYKKPVFSEHGELQEKGKWMVSWRNLRPVPGLTDSKPSTPQPLMDYERKPPRGGSEDKRPVSFLEGLRNKFRDAIVTEEKAQEKIANK